MVYIQNTIYILLFGVIGLHPELVLGASVCKALAVRTFTPCLCTARSPQLRGVEGGVQTHFGECKR